MNDPASIRMKLAWQNLFSLRTCPPDRILFSADRDPVLERHIEACPFCAERLSAAEEWSAWETLGSRLAEALPAAEHGAPVPGEIREVKAALGGWGPSNRYYNPPMVFILDIEASPIPCARVAQVCGDAALMGPDDAALPEDKGFVECWNTYALALEDIGPVRWGCIDSGTLGEVMRLTARAPQSVPEHSVLFFFRQLELEVAAHFAATDHPTNGETRYYKVLVGYDAGRIFTSDGRRAVFEARWTSCYHGGSQRWFVGWEEDTPPTMEVCDRFGIPYIEVSEFSDSFGVCDPDRPGDYPPAVCD